MTDTHATRAPLTKVASVILSIENDQRIDLTVDGTATRGYETYIKKYVGMIESGLLAKLTGTANKLLDAMGLRARILADPRRPGAEEEFQLLKKLGIATDKDRGELFCFSSLEQLARDTGIASLHTVEAGIEQLIKLQIVRKVSAKGQARLASGRFGSNVYFIQPASFIGKFDAEPLRNDGSHRWQKMPKVKTTIGNPPITVNRAIKSIDQQQKEEERVRFIARHFAISIGAQNYEPNEKENRKVVALLAEGYTVEEICAGITRAVERATTASRKVHTIAYCIPAIREQASQTPQGRAEKGAPQPKAVTGQPQAVVQVNPDLEKLSGGDIELRDLLEIVQERNPGRALQKSDVRAWQAVAERFRDLATTRDTTPIGQVVQAVLKGIGANSDREGFFAPSLAEAILENWQREQSEEQRTRTEDKQASESNEPGRTVNRPSKTLPAIQTSEGLLDPAQIWDGAVKELQGQMTKAAFDTWVKPTFVVEARDGDGQGLLGEPTLVIGTRNQYAVEWLEHRLHATIQRTVTGIVGRSVTVKYQHCT